MGSHSVTSWSLWNPKWSVLFLNSFHFSGTLRGLAFLPKFLAHIPEALWAIQSAHLESSGIWFSTYWKRNWSGAPRKGCAQPLVICLSRAEGRVPSCQAPVGSCSYFALSVSFLFRTEQKQRKTKSPKAKVKTDVVSGPAVFPLGSWHLLRVWAQTCHDRYSPRLCLLQLCPPKH